MTITNDYQVFLNGCIKNNAVDYKVLYENKCEECEKLKIQADSENTANMINKLNEEYQKLQEEFEDYKNKSEILDKHNNERAESFYDLSQTLMMTLLQMNCEHNPGENIYIGDQFDYRFTTDIRNAFEEAMDDMNRGDWNGDGRQCQMALIDNELCIDIRDPDDMTDEDSSDEE